MLIYINGHFVPKEEATVSVFDHGFLYGDGIYETMRAYNGEPFLLVRHMERLTHSAKAISLALPMPLEGIEKVLKETLRINNLTEAYLRLHISRGPGEIGLDPALCPAPTMVIIAKQFKDYPAEHYERGVSVAIVKTRRNHPLALDPSIKGTNFLNNILAKIESVRAGAYEGIMLNWEGFVAEGTICNVFMVKSGMLLTPALSIGILEGVTRGLVLDLARQIHTPAQEAAFRPQELMDADECFITNSTIEVMPVTIVDGKPVGNGKPGPVTTALARAYRDEVLKCSTTPPN
ncbi:MAG: branched-chain-amino-acid transaminase [Nitrospirota bacterium]